MNIIADSSHSDSLLTLEKVIASLTSETKNLCGRYHFVVLRPNGAILTSDTDGTTLSHFLQATCSLPRLQAHADPPTLLVRRCARRRDRHRQPFARDGRGNKIYSPSTFFAPLQLLACCVLWSIALQFAQRVKKVVLKAARHEVVNDKALISQYRSHVRRRLLSTRLMRHADTEICRLRRWKRSSPPLRSANLNSNLSV